MIRSEFDDEVAYGSKSLFRVEYTGFIPGVFDNVICVAFPIVPLLNKIRNNILLKFHAMPSGSV